MQMCNLCYQSPCHNMCPNYSDDRRIIGTCLVCGQEIRENDYIRQITDDESIHETCVQGFTPKEIFSLLKINPTHSFRNSDIDGSTFLELFGIQRDVAG